MCGIVGYIGKKEVTDILLNGLEMLEYRGYDSAGIAILNGDKINVCKRNGRLANLREAVSEKKMHGNLGIGHTRWATHGEPSKINSHPHTNTQCDIAVVHNGIIENYEDIKKFLQEKNYVFVSETDTEVIPHLIDYYYENDLLDAVKKATEKLKGSFALGVISSREPGKIVAVKRDSQMIVGTNDEGNFIASDIPAILEETRNIYLLEDDEFVVLTEGSISITDRDGNELKKELMEIKFSAEAAQKGGYEHFMLKEIHEQPRAIADTLRGRLDENLNLSIDNFDINKFLSYNKIYIVACGTAYHAGIVGKRAIESLAKIPVETVLASEFRYSEPIIDEETLVIVISQSGETADTISSLRLAKEKGAAVMAIVNVVGSGIARAADYVMYTYAGPEIAVASTKAYTTQLVALYLFAISLAEAKKSADSEYLKALKEELLNLPDYVSTILTLEEKIKKMTEKIYTHEHIYYLGRGLDYAVAMEGALKLKEVSYIHAETYAGGELKHGPIALIEEGTVVIAISTDVSLRLKMENNIKEVTARGAYTIGILSESCAEASNTFDDYIVLPDVIPLLSPVVSIITLQMLAYYTSIKRGCDVDKPRNLAKSVTVE